MIKRITKLPFIFYTHPKSYYEILAYISSSLKTYPPFQSHHTYCYHPVTSQGSTTTGISGLSSSELPQYAARRPSIDFRRYPLFCIKYGFRLFIIPALSVEGKSFLTIRAESSINAANDTLIVTGEDSFDEEIKSLLAPTNSLSKTETTTWGPFLEAPGNYRAR